VDFVKGGFCKFDIQRRPNALVVDIRIPRRQPLDIASTISVLANKTWKVLKIPKRVGRT